MINRCPKLWFLNTVSICYLHTVVIGKYVLVIAGFVYIVGFSEPGIFLDSANIPGDVN